MPPSQTPLPIDSLRYGFRCAMENGVLVLSAPTGSGKSTQVPRWCTHLGNVLVIESRRVACRSLAQRVAYLEGSPLGEKVGYQVRDENKSSSKTKILFATTGVVLKRFAKTGLSEFDTVILDEFHERSLDIDLILALILKQRRSNLVVMSATIEGDRVAKHIDGPHLEGEGRTFPVDIRHLGFGQQLPTTKGLEDRILKALKSAEGDQGDVLIFLPGKGEIASVENRLTPYAKKNRLTLIPLHGGLTLKEQGRAFEDVGQRKIILATNVAETSITLPGIRVVIDSGLARQTRYHQGRGYLGLVPIAQDSATQRAGRAGRTAPGVCYRLWEKSARIEPRTRPEIHRESLVPLVLASAACGYPVGKLPFLDPPKAYALEAAESELNALGALTAQGTLSDAGKRLFGLPLDAALGRLLVQAQGTKSLGDMVDLISVLAVNRPLFQRGPRPEDEDDDLQRPGCDVTAAIRALRMGTARRHNLNAFTLQEARRIRSRLWAALTPPGTPLPPKSAPPDLRSLALTALSADRRLAMLPRRRRRETAWANGGTELNLGRESALNEEKTEALLAFDTRAMGVGHKDHTLIITCAMPVPLKWLVRAGLGRERPGKVQYKGRKLTATLERVFAKRVIDTRETSPTGELALDAICMLYLRGSFFPKAKKLTEERLRLAALHRRLVEVGEMQPSPYMLPWGDDEDIPDLDTYIRQTLETLGVESGEDLELLSPEDLTAPPLPEELLKVLERAYPSKLTFPDATYSASYDLKKRQVILEKVKGLRKDPPKRAWLPAFKGLKVVVIHKNTRKILK